MKKNYVKPSLLSETFVSESIMTGEKEYLSTALNLYLDGQLYTNISFSDNNALNSIKVSDLTK